MLSQRLAICHILSQRLSLLISSSHFNSFHSGSICCGRGGLFLMFASMGFLVTAKEMTYPGNYIALFVYSFFAGFWWGKYITIECHLRLLSFTLFSQLFPCRNTLFSGLTPACTSLPATASSVVLARTCGHQVSQPHASARMRTGRCLGTSTVFRCATCSFQRLPQSRAAQWAATPRSTRSRF